MPVAQSPVRPRFPCTLPSSFDIMARLRTLNSPLVDSFPVADYDAFATADYLHRRVLLYALLTKIARVYDTAQEGNSGGSFNETLMYTTAAAVLEPRVICEIGLNAGHSMAAWLLASDMCTAEVYSFDIATNKYVIPIADFYAALLPGRFHFVVGDSTVTVPEFVRKVGASWRQCDLFHVDGGHFDEVPSRDIDGALKLLRSGGLFVMDDVFCTQMGYCRAPTAAITAAIERRAIVAPLCVTMDRDVHGVEVRGACVAHAP